MIDLDQKYITIPPSSSRYKKVEVGVPEYSSDNILFMLNGWVVRYSEDSNKIIPEITKGLKIIPFSKLSMLFFL